MMRLAFKYAPKEASKIMHNITKLDKKISSLTKNLSKYYQCLITENSLFLRKIR